MPKPSRQGWVQFLETNNNGNQSGGVILPFAAAAALNVGDVVWISADMTVNKSVVPADHQKLIGVVVGGARSSPLFQATGAPTNIDAIEPVYDPVAIAAGIVAAGAVGETVFVCVLGMCYVICDAVIAAGLRLSPSVTVAGRVRPSTDPVISAGAVAVTSSAANGAGTVSGDGFGRGVGKLLEASGGIGQVKRAFISLA